VHDKYTNISGQQLDESVQAIHNNAGIDVSCCLFFCYYY